MHEKLLNRLRIFLITGGMPSVVAAYAHNQDLLECKARLTDLIVSFRQDFAKYKKRVPATRIIEVFESVAAQVEGKYLFCQFDKLHIQATRIRFFALSDRMNEISQAKIHKSLVHIAIH